MLKLDDSIKNDIRIISATISQEKVAEMLATEGSYLKGHFIYPANDCERIGNHLDALFLIEPITKNKKFLEWIIDDICTWVENENISCDVIFAPAQPAVIRIVEELAKRLKVRTAYWEYLTTGWFGDKVASGNIKQNDRVLVFNGISQQGRCVDERLPQFVTMLGGEVVGAAVFAKGTAPAVSQAEDKHGKKLYSTIQVQINVQNPKDCNICNNKEKYMALPAIPWTHLRDQYK
jgi:hypothetical protein